ncbi:MAG: hypothetical protein WAO15_06080 [Mycobacterium sp.]
MTCDSGGLLDDVPAEQANADAQYCVLFTIHPDRWLTADFSDGL